MPGIDVMVARVMSLITRDAMLQVRGRRSGRMRTTLARVIEVRGNRYLLAIRGETQWARNLRAAGDAVLRERGASKRVRAIEVDDAERQAVFEAYLDSSNYAPTRRILTDLLPNADEHPVFKIQPLSGG